MWISFIILLIIALAACCMGFKKYVWFISIGYGAAIAALGIALLIMYHGQITAGTVVMGIVFLIYGCRLGGYLAVREIKSASYNQTMKNEIKDGSTMPMVAKISIWVVAALLYVFQVSPLWFRLYNHRGTDAFLIVGIVIMAAGIILESLSDLQKNRAKKKNPKRFVDTGLFRLVRCPNYLGELLLWTGTFISGINVYDGPAQWILVLCGFGGIVYVMFSGARRLEIRQTKNYGHDPEFQAYVKSTPIMIPFIPLYSVARFKWLVG